MKRDTFVLYSTYLEKIELLSFEQRGILFSALLYYANCLDLPDMDLPTKMAFMFIKSQLDIDKDKYEQTCELRRIAGAKGGASKGNKNALKDKSNSSKQANGCFAISTENIKGFSIQEKCEEQANQAKQALYDNEYDNEYENVLKERMNENKDNLKITNTRTYEEIMQEFCVSEFVKPYVWEFVKHCQLNGKTLTNDKLESILVDLDFHYKTDAERITCLENAVRGGYFDIKR